MLLKQNPAIPILMICFLLKLTVFFLSRFVQTYKRFVADKGEQFDNFPQRDHFFIKIDKDLLALKIGLRTYNPLIYAMKIFE